MTESKPRRLLGAVVVAAIALLLELLPSGPSPAYFVFGEQYVFVPTVWNILGALIAFAAGGYLSRHSFVPVAMAIAVFTILASQYLLYRIALPTGQADVIGNAIGNIPATIGVLASAGIGAYLGERLYARINEPSPSVSAG